MANYETMSPPEVQRLAKQGDKDALFEMAYRADLLPPEERTREGGCAWQDYWWEKAADAGHIAAKGWLARSLIHRIFDVDARNKAMKYFESLVQDLDAGKFAGNTDNEEDGLLAKLWLGVILCQGFGMGERRDPIRGAQLLRDADSATNGFDGFGFRVLNTLAEVYGQGCAQPGGELLRDDLRQAITYQSKAIACFNPERDDPHDRGYLELAHEYLDYLKDMKHDAPKDPSGFFDATNVHPAFQEWQDGMLIVSPAAQQRKEADHAAAARLRERLAREGWGVAVPEAPAPAAPQPQTLSAPLPPPRSHEENSAGHTDLCHDGYKNAGRQFAAEKQSPHPAE